ncbi:MAG TPA: SDR family NAD(P)-dependent oxidoreductase [Frankiaceae bacterium]|nr:SDR family NAD(P)-dependent oxidoreductase [Frankiaceae bacterium]
MTEPPGWPRAALVTGANRGLGHALVTELLERGVRLVVGTTRSGGDAPAGAVAVRLDYADADSIRAAGAEVAAAVDTLDLVVNCGAVNVAPGLPRAESKGPAGDLSGAALRVLLDVNVVGPALAAQAFLPLLGPGAVVVNVSSSRGSLALASDPGSVGYAVSKAALNMVTRKLAAELAPLGRTAVAVDPGWLRTDMGGDAAPRSAADAARDLVALLTRSRETLNGRFVTTGGEDLPW